MIAQRGGQSDGSAGATDPKSLWIQLFLVRPAGLEPAASCSLAKHIEGWQKRYHLTDEWVRRAAKDTLFIAAYFETKGIELDAPLPLIVVDPYATLHEGRVRNLADIPDLLSAMVSSRHEFTVAPVYIDDLKWSFLQPADIERSNDGFLAGFDPRTESIDDGVKRILPALEGRLRRALENVAGEDRLVNGALTISHFRKLTAFEWLVRFQVLGQSKAAIARKEEIERTNVGREIGKIADLVGITPRQSKGGRPRH